MSATAAVILASLAFVAGWLIGRFALLRRAERRSGGASFETAASRPPQDEEGVTAAARPPQDEEGVTAASRPPQDEEGEARPLAAPQDKERPKAHADLPALERALGLAPSGEAFWGEVFVNGAGWELRPSPRFERLTEALFDALMEDFTGGGAGMTSRVGERAGAA